MVPLSFAQQRLWATNRLGGSRSKYNISLVFELPEHADRVALSRALQDVMIRHEVLRTLISEHDGVAFQKVIEVRFSEVPITFVPCRKNEVQRHIKRLSNYNFDLANEPPIKSWLLSCDNTTDVLLLILHHIAVDGWSLDPLVSDLARAYAARRKGDAVSLEPLLVQYADYALWQREWLGNAADDGSVAAKELSYWRRQLAGLKDEIGLPRDHPRSTAESDAGFALAFRLDRKLQDGLEFIARQVGATFFMVIHAGLIAMLSAFGAGTDVCVGTVIAGRDDEALLDAVGVFVNPLVLRTDLSGDPTFVEMVERARDADTAAFEHRDLPFDLLVQALNPQRMPGRHPIFQVMLVQQTGPKLAPDALEEVGTPIITDTETAKFDLCVKLSAEPSRGRVAGVTTITLEFANELFAEQTGREMTDRLSGILTRAAGNPKTRLSGLIAQEPREFDRLVKLGLGKKQTVVDASADAVFDEIASTHPETIALADGEKKLTYSELRTKSSHVAQMLAAAGVQPETGVFIFLERTIDLVIVLLGVVKVGAYFVPLDRRYPPHFIAGILENVQGSTIIVEAQHLAPPQIPADMGVLTVGELTSPGADNQYRPRPTHPSQLISVMHTSGSTGRPKGIGVTHANVVSLARDQRWAGRHDRVLFHSSLAFDAAIYEIWVPLLRGGTVVLSLAGELTLDKLRQVAVGDSRPTALWLTASLFRLFAEEDPTVFSNFTELWTGGEVVSHSAVKRVLNACPGLTIVDGYGPTETTTFATCHAVRSAVDATTPIPIGRPMDGMRAYVLDRFLNPASVGVIGELYLSGTGTSQGYLKRPRETAERFVPDPFGSPGSRMYRTGDLARWTRASTLEFIGRVDHELKVRGFRIDPSVVEERLLEHPLVTSAVVVLLEDGQRDSRLVAYVVSSCSSDELKRHVRVRLPEFAVPSDIVIVPAIPLTANGKLDRRALPLPEKSALSDRRQPRTVHEEILCELFGEVLGEPDVGIDDTFFDLGGHSLSALRLIARIHSVLSIDFPMEILFEAPTPASLALRLKQDLVKVQTLPHLLPLRPTGDETPLILVHPAGGSAWSYLRLAQRINRRYPVYAIQGRGLSHPNQSPVSLIEMASNYLSYIRAVQRSGPYRLAGWSFGGVVAHEIARQFQEQGETVNFLGMFDSSVGAALRPTPSWSDLRDRADMLPDLLGVERELLESLPVGVVRDMFRSYIVNRALLADFTPGKFAGNLLYFKASTEIAELTANADIWRRYVTGTITIHDIPVSHAEMMSNHATGIIGPILNLSLQSQSG